MLPGVHAFAKHLETRARHEFPGLNSKNKDSLVNQGFCRLRDGEPENFEVTATIVQAGIPGIHFRNAVATPEMFQMQH